jgi:hypothetical protein
MPAYRHRRSSSIHGFVKQAITAVIGIRITCSWAQVILAEAWRSTSGAHT